LDLNVADQYTFSRFKYKTTSLFVLKVIKQSIKKTNQSIKIPQISIYMQDLFQTTIRKFNSNNIILHARLVPISIYNKCTTSDYIRTHLNHTKDQIAWFS